MNMLNEEMTRFLEWLDEQIKLTLREDKEAVMSHYCELKLLLWSNNAELEDVICYELVEMFRTMGEFAVLKEAQIYWRNKPSNEELNALLLEVPVRYIVMMLQLT